MSSQLMRQTITDYFKTQPVLKITTLLVFATFVGCKTNNITETQRFERSIMKELPFAVDSIHWLTGVDVPTFKFSNGGYTPTAPDAEIRPDGSWEVWKKFVQESF